jgi:uncharacterized membrane protein
MKRPLLPITTCMLALTVACESQNEEALFAAPEACNTPVSFSTQVAPLLQANCALSGCHAAEGTLPELTSFEKIKARAADIKQQTQARNMPPAGSGISLSQEEIDLLACWIDQGATSD